MEACDIHAVVDLADTARRQTHTPGQVVGQVTRQGDVVVDKGRVKAPDPLVALDQALRIVAVPAMLAVHAHRHTGPSTRGLALQRRQVAGVQHGRTPGAQQLHQWPVDLERLARGLVEAGQCDVRPLDTPCKSWRHLGQCHHGVAEGAHGHVVDQVHDAVFQPTGVEAVHQVHHQRWRSGIGKRSGEQRRLVDVHLTHPEQGGATDGHPGHSRGTAQLGLRAATTGSRQR